MVQETEYQKNKIMIDAKYKKEICQEILGRRTILELYREHQLPQEKEIQSQSPQKGTTEVYW